MATIKRIIVTSFNISLLLTAIGLPRIILWFEQRYRIISLFLYRILSPPILDHPMLRTKMLEHGYLLSILIGLSIGLPIAVILNRGNRAGRSLLPSFSDCMSKGPALSPWLWKCKSLPMLLVLVGILTNCSFWITNRSNIYNFKDIGRWLLGIGLVLIGTTIQDRRQARSLATGLHRLDVVILIVMLGLGLIYYQHDIHSFIYWNVGDQHTFYDYALDIYHLEGINGLFDTHSGPYSHHPLLGTVIQATVMKVAGDKFGFFLTSILFALTGAGAMYLALNELLGRRIALTATCFLLSSNLYLSFAHYGLNNNFSTLPIMLSLFWFVRGLKTDSSLFLSLSGVCAGVGIYLHLASFLLIPIFLLFLIFAVSGFPKATLRIVVFCGLGFIVAFAPTLPKFPESMAKLNRQSIFHEVCREELEISFGSRLEGIVLRVPYNFVHTIFIPFFLDDDYNVRRHFGGVVQVVTASFYLLGLFTLILNLHRNRTYPFALLSLVYIYMNVGAFQPYDPVSPTRIIILLPFYAMVVGLGLALLERLLLDNHRLPPRLISVLFLTFVLIDFGQGYYQTHVIKPTHLDGVYSEYMGYVLENTASDSKVYYIHNEAWSVDTPSLNFVFLAHNIRNRVTELTPALISVCGVEDGYVIFDANSADDLELMFQLDDYGYRYKLIPHLRLPRGKRFHTFYVYHPGPKS